MRSILVLAVFVCGVYGLSDTFTVNCFPLSIQRSDPIVSPGTPSAHLHSIIGGNNFQRSMDANTAYKATATTCDRKLDHSNYWVPSLYHINADGRYELVPWIASAVYYHNRACDYNAKSSECPRDSFANAFPDGFRMIAGDSLLRSFNKTNFAHQAVTMQCIDDDGFIGSFNGFPTRKCSMIRGQIFFPSCWDGKNLDTPNHKDHVAYPTRTYFVGMCPASHPVPIISLFFEWFFDTKKYNDRNFIFANGDKTGYGFHGDFIMGWTNRTALQYAHRTCYDFPNNCPIVSAGAQPGKNLAEHLDPLVPAPFEEDVGLNGPISQLPGNPKIDGRRNDDPPAPTHAPAPEPGGKFPNGDYTFKLAFTNKYIGEQASSGLLQLSDKSNSSVFTVNNSGTAYTILSKKNSRFVCAETAGNAPLIANRNVADLWESFTFEKRDNSWLIRSLVNKKLVASARGKLVASSDNANDNSVWAAERV